MAATANPLAKYLPPEPETVSFSVSLAPELRARFDGAQFRSGRNRAQFLAGVVLAGLDVIEPALPAADQAAEAEND